MSIRPAPTLLPVILLAAWSSLACDNDGIDTNTGPSVITSSKSAYISRADRVDPHVVSAVVVPSAVCPQTPPYVAPLNVVVRGDPVMASTLTGVQMQFTDTRGTVTGFSTFTHSHLTSRFGSTVVPLHDTRTFPVDFRFGCAGLATGTLSVVVLVTDSAGHERRSSHSVFVIAP
jgi:hypothetical protein